MRYPDGCAGIMLFLSIPIPHMMLGFLGHMLGEGSLLRPSLDRQNYYSICENYCGLSVKLLRIICENYYRISVITKWSNESEESLLYDSTKPLSYSCSGIEMFVKGGCRGYKSYQAWLVVAAW